MNKEERPAWLETLWNVDPTLADRAEKDLCKRPSPNNSEVEGKFVIVGDLSFKDYMKDESGYIKVYDSLEDAAIVCGMYEFPNALVMKVVYNHIEEDE